jgi:hypothetical protein
MNLHRLFAQIILHCTHTHSITYNIERTVGEGVSISSGTGGGVLSGTGGGVVTVASVGNGVNGVDTGGSVSGGRVTPGVGANVLFVPRTPSSPPSGLSMSPTAATRISFTLVAVDVAFVALPWTLLAVNVRPITSATV